MTDLHKEAQTLTKMRSVFYAHFFVQHPCVEDDPVTQVNTLQYYIDTR